MLKYSNTPITELKASFLAEAGIQLFVKREDLNNPLISGNKWWKLKYNVEDAKISGYKTLLTFGGAYSNHIIATAAAAKENDFLSIGIIRGEEDRTVNDTLKRAGDLGMTLKFVSREQYREKASPKFYDLLLREFGKFYLIPEGGTNIAAVKGCAEFARTLDKVRFDYCCLPVGTGGTMAGIIAGIDDRKKVIGFSVLKSGEFLNEDVQTLLNNYSDQPLPTWEIATEYHCGGYAKTNADLITFMNEFEKLSTIPLEPVYTGKMMYGIKDLALKGFFERGAIVLAIHTGGLQKF